MARFLWTQRSNIGPSPRTTSAMCYDSTRSRVVLFGGFSLPNTRYGDTWEWDGSLWTQMEDIGPAPRTTSVMVYDSTRKASVLFGGWKGDYLGDTWQWDGTDWTQLSESGPSARSSHAMAFDSARGRTVLFGGAVGGGSVNDTWEFDGQDWTQVQDAGPSARFGHSMAYDSVGARVVLFGGLVGGATVGDTWAWDGHEWAQIAEFGPSGRSNASIVSTGGGNLILYGGVISQDLAQEPLGDTWGFDGKHWTQLQDIGPGPLQGAAMAFDSGRGRIVLSGGLAVATGNEEQASPIPLQGFTWEAPVEATVGPPAGIAVATLSIPGGATGVSGGVPLPLTITLTGSGDAPTEVTFDGPIFAPNGTNLAPVMIPAAITTFIVQVAFAPQIGPKTFSAQVAGTPAVSLTVTVL
jgi:Galactose oxidase, central domain